MTAAQNLLGMFAVDGNALAPQMPDTDNPGHQADAESEAIYADLRRIASRLQQAIDAGRNDPGDASLEEGLLLFAFLGKRRLRDGDTGSTVLLKIVQDAVDAEKIHLRHNGR